VCVVVEPSVLFVERSAFAGFRFLARGDHSRRRWYLHYGLLHRDVEKLLAERVKGASTAISVWNWSLAASRSAVGREK
jgi:hypothetical protein